jgi:pyruvate,orthophosphate dikinase
MTRLGIPVPPVFTVTTEACLSYVEAGNEPPEGMSEQVRDALAYIEQQTSRTLGDRSRPLLVSCRSGAKSSGWRPSPSPMLPAL